MYTPRKWSRELALTAPCIPRQVGWVLQTCCCRVRGQAQVTRAHFGPRSKIRKMKKLERSRRGTDQVKLTAPQLLRSHSTATTAPCADYKGNDFFSPRPHS